MAQNPIVTIEMENGDIMKAELYPEVDPEGILRRNHLPSCH